MYDIFDQVLAKLKDGMEIVFTPNNVACGDDFLIFSATNKITVSFKNFGLWYVLFDGDEMMLLEECPDSFLESILLNIK